MRTNIKKSISLVLSVIFSVFLITPIAYAMECDKDGDGYIVIPTSVFRNIAPDIQYSDDDNYSPAEWQTFFNIYKNAELTTEETCDGLNFKKGAEPRRCDAIIISPTSGVYDPARHTSPLRGSQVNPGVMDIPDNGIDENCDGKDSSLLDMAGHEKDISGLADKVTTFLSRTVVFVSIIIMIYGGVLYATAAGDEAKTSKARKAIIGAVIGLLVGLLAPTIVRLIAASLI